MENQSCKFFDNYRIPEPSALLIFGASGNLTAIKLFPALFHLFLAKRLSPNLCIIGFSRTSFTDDEFRNKMKENVQKAWESDPGMINYSFCNLEEQEEKKLEAEISALPGDMAKLKSLKKHNKENTVFPEELWEKFSQRVFYHSGDGKNPDDYIKLAERVNSICDCKCVPENLLLYLATPPGAYRPIITNIEKSGFLKMFNGWNRIVVEKPFGSDLKTSQELNDELYRIFDESRIYRIDHYLGKETVQNILIFRFANGIFEPVWNRRYIDHVQILISEQVGVGKRGGYYEKSGALRDMVQNHMMQLLALTAMEPPVSFESDSIRDEKVKVIKSIRPITCGDVHKYSIRGQYSGGYINGEKVPGYRHEPGINPNSTTETYTALKVHLDNWRWAGVPFYLRTGKRLPERVTEVAIFFKEAPHLLFQASNLAQSDSNVLVLRIQPDEGIFLRFGVKVPGTEMRVGNVNMNFSYKEAFHQRSISAYERLLLDFMMGDSSLFARRDGVEAMWKFADSIEKGWSNCHIPQFPNYTAGTWGPKEAEDFIRRDGRSWRVPRQRTDHPSE